MSENVKIARKPTNISLPVDLCIDAKELGVNISQVCEQALREVVGAAKQSVWAAENKAFIAEYNKRVEAEGTLLQDWNAF